MTSNIDLVDSLIFLAGTTRVICVIIVAIAIHDVVRNGLHVRYVPKSARVVLYFTMVTLIMSTFAAVFRLSGQEWAPAFREITHSGVSVGIVAASLLVLLAKQSAGELYNSATGSMVNFTSSGPCRDVSKDEDSVEMQFEMKLAKENKK